MMYNEEIKKEYITWKYSTTIMPYRKLERVFEKLAKKEMELGKDCCNFTKNEIEDYYKELNMPDINTVADFHSILKVYVDWCFSKNLCNDGQNHFTEIQRKDYVKYINMVAAEHKFITEEILDEWISKLVNPCDQFLLRAMWEGLGGKGYSDVYKVKLSDFKDGIVELTSGRKIEYSEKLYALAKRSSEQTVYEINNGFSTSERGIKQYNLIGTTVIRVKDSNQNPEDDTDLKNIRRRMGVKLRNIFSYLGVNKWMTPMSVRDSAIILYVQALMEKGIDYESIGAVGSPYRNYISNQWDIANVKTHLSKYSMILKH